MALLATTFAPVFIRTASIQLEAMRAGESFPIFSSGLFSHALLVLLLNAVAWLLLSIWQEKIAAASEAQAEFTDTVSPQFIGPAIVVAAGLSLFLELAVIRWQVSIIPLLSFYKNFGVLSCFAGLGLGYALAHRNAIPLLFVIPLLALQIVSQMFLKFALGADLLANAVASPIVEQVNMGVIGVRTSLQVFVVYFTLAGIFLVTALAFLPLGQIAGRFMTRATGNLRAYGYNLLGSLGGVVAMQVMSYLWTPPILWFGLSFCFLLPFLAVTRRILMFSSIGAAAVLTIMAWPVGLEVQRVYSPYQLIEREYTPDGLMHIRAAGHTFQTAHNLARDYVEQSGDLGVQRLAKYYELPYIAAGAPETVAVVGAGTGNDVAAALRMGAAHVDAVEIDPAVLRLGRVYHPERPYDDPKVTSVVDDARSHFRATRSTYDLIVYGLLDSHTVLSHSSSVRLDSFVYTVEGFREARSRLAEDGAISLSFFVLTPELAKKIYGMLEEAFDGRPPIALRSSYSPYYLFLQGRDRPVSLEHSVIEAAEYIDVTQEMAEFPEEIDLATDDWPFFYMPKRIYPFSYVGVLAMFLMLTLVLVGSFVRERPEFSQGIFFFLGAGFMLIETKGITELGLTFGNTWQVIGVVISGVLVMAFFANLAVARLQLRGLMLPFLLLFASLAVGYMIAAAGGFPSNFLGRWATVFVLTVPLFFSGIVFSTAIRMTSNISGIMAANLLGAMLGGLLEYNSMKFGFQALYVLGIAVYGLAAVSYLLSHRIRTA